MSRPPDPINELPDTFWAWLAGFLDGDGCIGLYGNGQRRLYPLVSISQKLRPVLDYIVKSLGVGSVSQREKRATGQVYYGITFGSAAAREICLRTLPFLVVPEKISAAKDCLAWKPLRRVERSNAMEANPKYAQAVSRYRSGLSLQAIGNELGVSSACVLKWLRRAGVKRRGLAEAQKKRRERM